ncbi:MAG: gfo/Idh/MocA family oxidoreductase [Planctomycetaceae bacterium]|nr:MAG: gfo/Idh/MocA family oxidoreductase [Planctomycetaceae bacterium]
MTFTPNQAPRPTRRFFLQAGLAVPALGYLPAARAASPNGKFRTAHIGVGGMGGADLNSIASHAQVEVAALCDVDSDRLAAAGAKHTGARRFKDYREMLSELGDQVDGVVVSTPDHTHAPAAMTAMLQGKPVYCQKPLTHEVFEARQLRTVAKDKGLVTQMGIQVHSSAPYRRAVQMIQTGVIGPVSQVFAWSNKNWGYDGGPLTNFQSPPASLDWDLWLGTAAEREFVPSAYHPGNWRKMIDFGTGTLGDMGVHIFDTPYAALELTAPRWAMTTSRPPTHVGHPERNVVRYEFPGTKHTTDKLIWTWYDGNWAPPELDLDLPRDWGISSLQLPGQGALFVGEGGLMLLPHVGEPVLMPETKFSGAARPEVANGNHYHEWVDACRGEGKTSAGFDYAGPLTEALLLGVVANRFPDQRLMWDADDLRVTNLAAANELLRSTYREGFAVAGL